MAHTRVEIVLWFFWLKVLRSWMEMVTLPMRGVQEHHNKHMEAYLNI